MTSPMIHLRKPVPQDGSAIERIDAEGRLTGHATFRDTPLTWDLFEASYLNGVGVGLVAEEAGAVVGWAAVGATSGRPVYRGVGEVSIYVSAGHQGSGVGRVLLNGVIAAAEQVGYWTLIAQIFPENPGSVALHQSAGFEILGTRRKLGQMPYGPLKGQWRDVLMLERRSAVIGV